MKTLSIKLAALAIVLLACSTASAAWVHVGPRGVVYRSGPAPYVYRAPVPRFAPPAVVYPAPRWIYPTPTVVHPVYYPRAYPRTVRSAYWYPVPY